MTTIVSNINLGQVYKDRVSGFTGTATVISKHINGCQQIVLTPKVDKENKVQDGHWFDEQRLVNEDGSEIAAPAPQESTAGKGGCAVSIPTGAE